MTTHLIEERTYYPCIKSFGNNDIVEIAVNQTVSWFLMPESSVSINEKIEVSAGNGEVNLSPNTPAFFFDSFTNEQYGKEMESV